MFFFQLFSHINILFSHINILSGMMMSICCSCYDVYLFIPILFSSCTCADVQMSIPYVSGKVVPVVQLQSLLAK